MNFHYATNDTCHTADGLVIVIDVLRAFSTAAYAFEAGAESITLVSAVEAALALKQQLPGALVMGEVGGLPPAGFDFGNSPAEIARQNLKGLHLIQRTGAGTQGAVRSVNADRLFAASFVVAKATVQAVQRLNPEKVTFVVTGGSAEGEDLACAEYLEACLRNRHPEPEPFLSRVRNSAEARRDARLPSFVRDLAYCTRLDACPFAMPITRADGRLVMRALTPET